MTESQHEWKKCRKRPVEVEFRDVIGEVEEIETHEGKLMAYADQDYIVRGVKGEVYPIKKEVFEATYHDLGGGRDRSVTFYEEARRLTGQRPPVFCSLFEYDLLFRRNRLLQWFLVVNTVLFMSLFVATTMIAPISAPGILLVLDLSLILILGVFMPFVLLSIFRRSIVVHEAVPSYRAEFFMASKVAAEELFSELSDVLGQGNVPDWYEIMAMTGATPTVAYLVQGMIDRTVLALE